MILDMRGSRIYLSALILLATMIACTRPGPDKVVIKEAGLFPEGLEFSPRYNVWLVSSLTRGVVHQIKDDGTIKPLIKDDANLVSVIGIRIDDKRDRVLVANSDNGVGDRSDPSTLFKLAGLGIYKLSTGEKIAYADLGALRPEGAHFANDIALDGKGNAYVTDSRSPIIYKVDPDGNASVLIENSRFSAEGTGLNGIAFHPNGFLVVAKMDEGLLFKVPLTNPDNFREISLGRAMPGADGIFWSIAGDLVVNANGKSNAVFLVKSSDGWDSGRIAAEKATGDVFVTTGVLRGNEPYVLYAHLHKLFGGDTTHDDFTINKIKF